MYDKTDLRAAIEAGAISDESAKRLESFLKARNDPDRMLDPENLRFLSNFNDVFLTIGIVILMVGLGFLSGISVFNLVGPRLIDPENIAQAAALANSMKLVVILTPIPVLVGAWLLAEYFCGKRRLLLPSMALSGIIVWAAAAVALGLFAPVDQSESYANPWSMLFGMSYAGFVGGVIAAAAIFWRFRLPFSLFLLAGGVAGLFYTAVAQLAGIGQVGSGLAMLTIGVGTLAAAIAFDMKDPTRSTRSSDCAFWLHMAAAPQIILGMRGLLLGSGFAPASMTDATVMLIVLLAFALLSLALNRRALIVSGLVTFATSLWFLVNEFGGGGVNTLMLTALIIGGAIVLLGGGWRTARRAILKFFPQQGTLGRIFPPEPA
ncbi:MAG: hypothetical protein EON61_03710 [Alphaproteobacteria bacterium]|jgi:hypothetical protein|nr:MAG: hypothetical protein EON61_03710 [Alphaproteobacteria bacterium]